MIELVRELFFAFSLETGILGVVKENEDFLIVTFLAVAILLCLFGFKVYRAIFSLLTFMATTLLIVFIMRGRTDWGTITTTFAVLGSIFSFFAYREHKLGGYCISILCGATITWVYTQSLAISIIAGIFVGVTMSVFPVITLCFMTALWGAIVIQESSVFEYMGTMLSLFSLGIGFILQMFISRNQTLFEESYLQKKVKNS